MVLEANQRACDLYGYSSDEFLGKSLVDMSSDAVRGKRLVANTLCKNGTFSFETTQHRKDGTAMLLEVRASVVDYEGRSAILSINRDITKRRQVEEALAESEAKIRLLVESAGVILWEFDPPRGAFTYVSPQAATLGYPLEQWYEPGFWLDSLHPEDRDRISAFCLGQIEAGLDHRMRYRMLKADGSVLWVDDVVTVVKSRDGSVVLRGVFIDVTESQLHREEIARALRAAEAASRAKSEFLANVSHEIRTPMTAILGYAELLRADDDTLDSATRRLEIVDTIRDAGEHLMNVINDILDLSKIEADKMTVEAVETSLPHVLMEVESLVRPLADAKGVALEMRLDSPIPSHVLTDPTRLRQMLVNLAGNAVKFTGNGTVTIKARSASAGDATRLTFDVEDTGPGLTPEQVSRLFAAFTQGDSTMTRLYGGTGLGLVISRRLAKLMGGNVTLAHTELGKGSCFRLELPVGSTAACSLVRELGVHEVAHEPEVAAAPASLEGRILLAEDNPVNQRLIAFHLRKAGAEVDVVEHGAEALERLAEAEAAGRPHDLLLTDMQMPVMDGYTLARELRSRGSKLAIVALTAHAMAEDRNRCLEAGCDGYTTKPIDRATLLARCADWMGKEGGAVTQPVT